MTYADILNLLRAGYTKDEIDAMEAPAAQQETQPETQQANQAPATPAQEPAQEAQPAAPAPEAQPAGSTATPPDTLPTVTTATPPDPTQQILQQLTELVKSVQAQNRGAAEIRGNIIEPGAQAMDTLRSLGGIPAAPENK